MEYAHRIEDDLPDTSVIIKEQFVRDKKDTNANGGLEAVLSNATNPHLSLDFENTENCLSQSNDNSVYLLSQINSYQRSFKILGLFREQVVATFDSPF